MKDRATAEFCLAALEEELADIDYLIERYEHKLWTLRQKREQCLTAQDECRNLLK